jgi:hypothetical protein
MMIFDSQPSHADARVTRHRSFDARREMTTPAPRARACVRVIEDFIDAAFERETLASWCEVHARGLVQLHGRRCAALGGTVHAKGTIAVDDIPRDVRELMAACSARVREEFRGGAMCIADDDDDAAHASLSRALESFEANHALVNVYDDGCGILPHEDGPLYAPVVCIVSCGASRSMRFEPKRRRESMTMTRDGDEGRDDDATSSFEVCLPARSLLVFYGAAYTDYLHGIDDETSAEDARRDATSASRGPRVSLTLRRVLNMKRGFEFLTRKRQT